MPTVLWLAGLTASTFNVIKDFTVRTSKHVSRMATGLEWYGAIKMPLIAA
jgi:hypothetical protein